MDVSRLHFYELVKGSRSARPHALSALPSWLLSRMYRNADHLLPQYSMASLPKFVQQTSVYKDELTLYVAPSAVVPVMHFLRDHTNTQYKSVMDICGADYPQRSKRFEVVYHLLSVKHNSRIRVKTYADEVSPVPSVVPLFRGADW